MYCVFLDVYRVLFGLIERLPMQAHKEEANGPKALKRIINYQNGTEKILAWANAINERKRLQPNSNNGQQKC